MTTCVHMTTFVTLIREYHTMTNIVYLTMHSKWDMDDSTRLDSASQLTSAKLNVT